MYDLTYTTHNEKTERKNLGPLDIISWFDQFQVDENALTFHVVKHDA